MNIQRSLLIALLSYLCLVSRRPFRSVLNPIVVACSLWLIIVVADALFYPNMYLSVAAAVLIGTSVVCASAGAYLAVVRVSSRPLHQFVLCHRNSRATLRFASFAVFLAAALATAWVAYYYGVQLGSGVSADGSGTFVSYHLYDAVFGSAMAWPFRVATTVTYVGAAFLGLELQARKGSYWIGGLFVLICVTDALFVGSKYGMCMVLSLYMTAWVVIKAPSHRTVSMRIVVIAGCAALLTFGLVRYAIVRRTGTATRSMDQMLASTLVSSPAVLSGILADRNDWIVGTLAGDSIRGPLLLLTTSSPDSWGYVPYRIAPDNPEQSNVVSGLWQLLADVGVGGMIVVLFAVGFAAGRLYLSVYAKPTPVKAGALMCVYLFLFWMPVNAMTHYVMYWSLMVCLTIGAGHLYTMRRCAESAWPYGLGALPPDYGVQR